MLTFLLIVLLVSFVLRRLLPWLLKLLVGKVVREATAASQEPTGGAGRAPREGRVRVDYVPPASKRQPRPEGYRGGDYVEFEEVK